MTKVLKSGSECVLLLQYSVCVCVCRSVQCVTQRMAIKVKTLQSQVRMMQVAVMMNGCQEKKN